MAMITIPVDLCVRRYYRVYVTVPDGTTDEEIRRKIVEDTDLNQELTDATLDPSMDIEYDDITGFDIDHEGEWIEED